MPAVITPVTTVGGGYGRGYGGGYGGANGAREYVRGGGYDYAVPVYVGRKVLGTCTTTLYDVIRSTASLSMLANLVPELSALLQAEMKTPAITAESAVTFFAPSNDAISRLIHLLPDHEETELLRNSTALTVRRIKYRRGMCQLTYVRTLLRMQALISYHIVPHAKLVASALGNNTELTTALTQAAGQLKVERSGAGGSVVTIQAKGSSAHVTVADQAACNAVLHIVDNVLLPLLLP